MIEPLADTVCAIIPAHEEERFIAEVVRAVRAHVEKVIVVDDHITGVLTEHQSGRVLGMPPRNSASLPARMYRRRI